MTPVNRVIKNTGILYARMAITVFLSLYTTRLVLGALGAEDFGIFSVVGGTIAMLTFLNASMTAATQRFMSFAQGQGDEDRQHQIFNVSTVLHAVIAMLVLGLLEGVGLLLFDGVLKIEPARMHAAWLVYQFAAISTFFTILAAPYDAVINAHEHMMLFAVLGIIEAVLKLAIALIIADGPTDKLELYGMLMAVLSIVLLLVRIAYCHRKYPECKLAIRHHFSRPLFNEMTSFSGWSLLGTSASMLSNYGQALVLNMFFGARVNAAQGISSQVSGQLGVFASAMLRALNPLIAKSEGAGNRELVMKASAVGGKASCFLLMIVYVPVLVEMQYVLESWLKTLPPHTVVFCSLLLLRNLIEQLFVTLVASISAAGKIKFYQISASILALLPLPISYFLFRVGFSPIFLYITFLIYSIFASTLILFFSKKILHLKIFDYMKNVVLRSIISFSIVIGISSIPLLIMDPSFFRFSIVSVTSTASLIVSVWGIGLNQAERQFIRTLGRTWLERSVITKGIKSGRV